MADELLRLRIVALGDPEITTWVVGAFCSSHSIHGRRLAFSAESEAIEFEGALCTIVDTSGASAELDSFRKALFTGADRFLLSVNSANTDCMERLTDEVESL